MWPVDPTKIYEKCVDDADDKDEECHDESDDMDISDSEPEDDEVGTRVVDHSTSVMDELDSSQPMNYSDILCVPSSSSKCARKRRTTIPSNYLVTNKEWLEKAKDIAAIKQQVHDERKKKKEEREKEREKKRKIKEAAIAFNDLVRRGLATKCACRKLCSINPRCKCKGMCNQYCSCKCEKCSAR